jgi:protein phosphatase
MASRLTLHAACGTDPGQLREINQDNVFVLIRQDNLGEPLGLLVVADGMGGHKAGEIASQLAVDTIKNSLSWMLEADDAGSTVIMPAPESDEHDSQNNPVESRLRLAVEEANRVIFEYAQANPDKAGNLGCTITCAMVSGDKAAVANVGDSRAYRMHDGKLTQVTQDHSYVWQLVTEGYIEEAEIFDHPQRNVITRALGNQPEVVVDTWTFGLDPGDRLLLCSDGMWEMIRDPSEIALNMDENKLQSVVDGLIKAANNYGGYDNIGVVVAELRSEEI